MLEFQDIGLNAELSNSDIGPQAERLEPQADPFYKECNLPFGLIRLTWDEHFYIYLRVSNLKNYFIVLQFVLSYLKIFFHFCKQLRP